MLLVSLSMGGSTFSWVMVVAAIAYFANFLVGHGDLAPDQAPMVLLSVFHLVGGVAGQGRFFGDKNVAVQAASRLMAIMDQTPSIDIECGDGLKPIHMLGRVVFEHVRFCYGDDMDRPVLKDFQLEVRPGTITALVGPVGCGKTSALNLVLRFYDPQSGVVTIDGIDVRALNLHWLRQNMAFVHREAVLFAGTIQDNIRYARPSASQAEVEAASRVVQAHRAINQMPGGYLAEASAGHGSRFGTALKQQIALARAVLRGPAVLLMDEAVDALDSISEKAAMAELRLACTRRPMSIMMVAQKPTTLEDTDQIVVMSSGVVVEKGSHGDLAKAPGGHYSRLVALQQRSMGKDFPQ